MKNANDEVVRNVCEMAAKIETLGNVSMLDLIAQSGYLSSPRSLTEARIRKFLTSHPQCVEEWLLYSENQRGLPAWFLSEPGSYSVSDNAWAVGRVSIDGKIISRKRFADQISATAHFIKLEAERLAR